MADLPVIVVVTAEWCGHCQEAKRGGANSEYAKIVETAKKYGDVMIVNYPMEQGKQPKLSYIPPNFYRQVRGFPSIIVFKRSLWNELYKDLSAIGSPVRSGFRPDVLESFLRNMGFSEVSGGRIYSHSGDGKDIAVDTTSKEQLLASIQTPAPALSAQEAAASVIRNSDITHVIVGGQRLPLKEYLIARGTGGW